MSQTENKIAVGSEWVSRHGEIVRVSEVTDTETICYVAVEGEGFGAMGPGHFRKRFAPVRVAPPAPSPALKDGPLCIKCGIRTGAGGPWVCTACAAKLPAVATDTSVLTEGLEPTPLEAPPDNVPARLIAEECDQLKRFLLLKNAAYGNSAFEPLRIFSLAHPTEQIRVRLDDKLSRLARGNGSIEVSEDTILDLLGYLVLLRVSMRTDASSGYRGPGAGKDGAA